MKPIYFIIPLFVASCSYSPFMTRNEVISETNSRIPDIRRTLEKKYGLTCDEELKIAFKKEPEEQIVQNNDLSFAVYDQVEDEITVYYDNIWKQNMKLDADAMWNPKSDESYFERNIENVLKETITRFYLDQMSENSNNGSFPAPYINVSKKDKWSDLILMYGIVSYIKYEGDVDIIDYDEYKVSFNKLNLYLEGVPIKDFTTKKAISTAQLMGEHIVYPLIKIYGKGAIKTIIENQTTFNTGIKYPVGYRAEILKSIANK